MSLHRVASKGNSQNSLDTVLELVVAPRAPIIHALSDEAIYVLLALDRAQSALIGEQSILKVSN